MFTRKSGERALLAERRAHAQERAEWLRERGELLDRIMYLAERPWSAPPAEYRAAPSAEDLSPEVAWPIVLPEGMTPEEMDELAPTNGTG